MTDKAIPKQQVAEELRKHRPSPLRSYPPKCRCGDEYDDFYLHAAEAAIDALQLTEETLPRYEDPETGERTQRRRLVGPYFDGPWIEGER